MAAPHANSANAPHPAHVAVPSSHRVAAVTAAMARVPNRHPEQSPQRAMSFPSSVSRGLRVAALGPLCGHATGPKGKPLKPPIPPPSDPGSGTKAALRVSEPSTLSATGSRGFQQVVGDPHFHSADRVRRGPIPTEGDERDRFAAGEGAKRPREAEPVHPRHDEGEEHDRRAAEAGAGQARRPVVTGRRVVPPQRDGTSAVLSAASGRSSTTRT